jgi:UDP-N-acetyl-2-amino-2-deoxyglucuronate dehydrogenase
MLTWVFGSVTESIVHVLKPDKAAGLLRLQQANIRWFLSIDYNDIPAEVRQTGKRTFRSLTMEGTEIEFSDGFTDLHSEVYRQIMAGHGFGLKDARQSINIVYQIRNGSPIGLQGDYHPFLKTIGKI